MRKWFAYLRNPFAVFAILLLILLGIGGYNLLFQNSPAGVVKGPQPRLTERAIHHIEERHVNSASYPTKSKFEQGIDYKQLVFETYDKAQSVIRQRQRYIYDYDTGFVVGRRGQTSCRLVTEEDGEVVTFFPRFS